MNKGFTLIELMIVIAIIGIVAAIAIPFATGDHKSNNSDSQARTFAKDILNISDPKVNCIRSNGDWSSNICTVAGYDASNNRITESLDCRNNGCTLKR